MQIDGNEDYNYHDSDDDSSVELDLFFFLINIIHYVFSWTYSPKKANKKLLICSFCEVQVKEIFFKMSLAVFPLYICAKLYPNYRNVKIKNFSIKQFPLNNNDTNKYKPTHAISNSDTWRQM